MRRTLSRIITVLAMMLAVTAPTVVVASPAAGALPTCTHFTTIYPYWPGEPMVQVTFPTTSAGSGNYRCVMGLGSHSWGVWALQRALNLCHNAGLVQDAVYGQLTRNAVLWVQAAAGITADGVYGPNTAERAVKFPYTYLNDINRVYICLTK